MYQGRRAFEIKSRLKIKMRDGVQLNCTLYLPLELSRPTPSILLITPYVADTYHERGTYFASFGWPFAILDSRGRGDSEGVFEPYADEAHDGFDTVEWLAGQPWCDGRVAMWGGSYNGQVQWAAAKEVPPHLETIVPVASPHLGTDVPMRCNIVHPYMVQWLGLTEGRPYNRERFEDNAYWSSVYVRWHKSGRPLRDLDRIAGIPSPLFQKWLDHPEPDAYWDALNPTGAQYAKIEIPVLTITGSYDDDQPGALAHYQLHLKHASPGARANHFLVIGPWDHFGTRTPKANFGGLKFHEDCLIDLPKLHREWYAWTMRGGARPGFLRKPVAYYVMGAEKWRYADALEVVTSHYQPLYLDSLTNACDMFSAGTLQATIGVGDPDRYVYDPRDIDKPEVEAEARTHPASLVDQSVLLALRGKVLVYQTTAFKEPQEISGFMKLSAWIAIDGPDTDLYASVHEVTSDGRSMQLTTDAIRARYREGVRNPRLISTRLPLRYDFESFTFVSREIRPGHRLRLVLAPTGRLTQALFTQRNFQGGGVIANESIDDAKSVGVSLFHDQNHPSVLLLPIGRLASSDEPVAPVAEYRLDSR